MRRDSHRRPLALLVTRNFPPMVGGMENLNQRLLRELARDRDMLLCGPSGSAAYAAEAFAVAESRLKPLPLFLAGTAVRAAAMALRFRPGLVVAGSGLTAPLAWVAARSTAATLAVYLHGLDIVAPSRVYQRLWLPFIRACDVVLVNSANTASLAISRGVDEARIHVLHPGTDVPRLDPTSALDFRRQFGLADRPVLLSVGRLTRRKGLAEFVAQAMPAVVARNPAAILVIVGEEATDALRRHAGSERDRIVSAARAAGVESSVMFIGRRDNASLCAAYQVAQVHVFPVLEQSGDVEGFGMVALEAAAHGLRTVAFAVGGVPDAVSDPETGKLVPPGAYGLMTEAISNIIASPQTEAGRQGARKFAVDKDWTAFGNRLRALVQA